MKNPDKDTKIITHFDEYPAKGWSFEDAGSGRLCWACGYAFFEGRFYDAESLGRLFLEKSSLPFDNLKELLLGLYGNFAAAVSCADFVFAAVDHVRSIPLFYSQKGAFYLSNSARRIRERCAENDMDEAAFDEFLCAGYVAGEGTLFRGIKQLGPGECLFFDRKKNSLAKSRYYRYITSEMSEEPKDKLLERFDEALTKAFGRLCESARAKTLAVPLSGGLDSRLVASMLKRMGYEDVVCFTYGRPGSADPRKGREIAEALGYRWRYVEYTPAKWRVWQNGGAFKKYLGYGDNLSSLPHIDDWAAVKELKEKNEIPEDAVFVPGHTGDFISGGHLKYIFDSSGVITEDKLIEHIIDKHYSLWPGRLKEGAVKSRIREKIIASLSGLPRNTIQELASAYEYWEWQGRQSRFIINSVRVYDFWGHEWRLPLWDLDVMNFWKEIPYALKLDKDLYKAYLGRFDRYGVFVFKKDKDLKKNIMGNVFERRDRAFMRGMLSLYGTYRRLKGYFDEPKAQYALFNYARILFNITRIRNTNSFLAQDYLNGLSRSIKTAQRYGSRQEEIKNV